MQYQLQLSYSNPLQFANLQFNPDELRIINNTSQMIYVRRGSNSNPSSSSFDYAIQPLQIITLPASYTQYAFYLDVTGMLDTAQVCTVIFNSFDYKNFSKPALLRKEVLLKPSQSLQSVNLDFNPRVMIAVNNSDGNLYVRRGSQSPISSVDYDYLVRANTSISIPVTGIEFNLLLDSATEYSCLVVFVNDYRFSVNTIPATSPCPEDPIPPIVPYDVTISCINSTVFRGNQKAFAFGSFNVGNGLRMRQYPSGGIYWFYIVYYFNEPINVQEVRLKLTNNIAGGASFFMYVSLSSDNYSIDNYHDISSLRGSNLTDTYSVPVADGIRRIEISTQLYDTFTDFNLMFLNEIYFAGEGQVNPFTGV